MLLPISRPFCIAALIVACVAQLRAAEPLLVEQSVKKLILPGESFLAEGRPAFILWPPEEKRQKRVRAGVPLVSLVHPLIDRGVGEEIGGDWPRNNDRVYDVVIPGA